MPTPLDDYKELIDALVKRRPCVLSRRVRERKDWPKIASNNKINKFLATLSDAERALLAELLQQARDGGIHDTLAYLHDEIALRGLQITRNNQPIAFRPFGSELYYDWMARLHEDDWPDPIADET